MADLLYSWGCLEDNIIKGDVGYLHGKLMKFNEYKKRNPDFIWLVRLKNKRLWLLGKLKVTDTKSDNFPNDHKRQFIFYSPSESFFFRDTQVVQENVDIEKTLNASCEGMRKGNMQGASSLVVLEPPEQRELERLTKNHALLSFDEFKQNLLNRSVSNPPYELASAKKSAKPDLVAYENDQTLANKSLIGADANSDPQTMPVEERQELVGAGSAFNGELAESNSPDSNEEAVQLVLTDEQLVAPITANDQETLELDTPGLKTDEREAVVKVRFGQGGFRDALLNYKNHGAKCWMSGIEDKRLLIASHIKPWSHCKDASDARGCLDNGLLLSALWDAVFDAGLISFDADYKVVASSALSETARSALNLNEYSALPEVFRTNGRQIYLAYHRAEVFENWKSAESMTDGHN